MRTTILYENVKSRLFLKEEEGKQTIIKSLNLDFPTPQEIANFYNEYDILSELELEGVPKVYEKTRIKNNHAFELEWFEGQTLNKIIYEKQKNFRDFLQISLAITQVLHHIHIKGVIHLDINPSNILVNLKERKVKIIDFGNASRYDLNKYDLRNPTQIQGTLNYCSPEQTGRINRQVDCRSDLYSLGVCFYEMLTGQLPFIYTDLLELVHAHIAQTPIAPNEINQDIPVALSHIVMKLMAKNAEDRYQSSAGLLFDLEKCNTFFSQEGKIPNLILGERDYSGIFKVPQKLVGRETEIQLILSEAEDCFKGRRKLLLIDGYSGTGKTSLVHEIHKPITLNRGYYAEGKFDQLKRASPYLAFIQAFTELINILLTESEEQISQVGKELQAALGEEGKILTDILPGLEHIIGPQKKVPELGIIEQQQRFNYVFRKFFYAWCTSNRPVVIFIDDLQWADWASLQLLENIFSNPDGGYFLCIGAYRSNEVQEGHPLQIAIQNLKKEELELKEISIGNLQEENVHQIVASAILQVEEDNKCKELTTMVYLKTNGNAFFVKQFLQSLADENLLFFDHKKNIWNWDLAAIQQKNITENVVDLMASKVRKVSLEEQQILKLVACLGGTVSYSDLSKISDISLDNLNQLLYKIYREGLLVPVENHKLRFSHDRIQQAVYELLNTDEKSNIHLQIGEVLMEGKSDEELEESLFDIIGQFNAAISLIQQFQPSRKQEICQLNIRAGKKARNNSAFLPALEYFQTAENLLPEDHWQQNYDLSIDLYNALAEVSYVCAKYDITNEYFEIIDRQAKKTLDKVPAYEIRINTFKAKNDLPSAIETGLKILDELGEKIPHHPNKLQVLYGLALTEYRLWNLKNEDILKLPKMVNPSLKASLQLMADIAPSAYWARPNLIPILAFRMINVTLKHGLTEISAFAFSGYGIIMTGVLKAMRKGQRYGQLGLLLLDKLNSKEWITQIVDPVYALINHWNEHVDLSLKPLQDSFHTGLETGENEFACVNANIYCIHAFLCGKPLVKLEEEAKNYSKLFQRLNQETQFNYNEVFRQSMHSFLGLSEDPQLLIGSAYDEVSMESLHLERKDQAGEFLLCFNRMLVSFYFGNYEKAVDQADKAVKLIDAVMSKYEIPNLFFYQALSALGLYQSKGGSKQKKLIILAKKNLGKLQYFAKYAPENVKHKCLIIESQLYLVKGKFEKTRLLFDQAIKEAGRQHFIHEEGLANELAGHAYEKEGYSDLAEHYLRSAFRCYEEWGAEAKLLHLSKLYPRYISSIKRGLFSNAESIASNTSNSSSNTNLDLSTLLKASTAISGEVEMSKLLLVMMKIVMENAGASRGVLVLEKDNNPLVEAVYDLSTGENRILEHLSIEKGETVPESILKYVLRTNENIVTQTKSELRNYTSDPYLQNVDPESVLCFPINSQGRTIGLIYLENRFVKNVFTRERIELLSLLSGQIAVSLENAFLYNNLEIKVKERTVELQFEKERSDQLLANILPKETAIELKETGETKPRSFDSVSILFTDFVGFSTIAKTMSPIELVNTVDMCFRAFDEIVERNHLEKIKTIGDSYMCAGGLPVQNSTHPEDIITAALEMLDWMEKFNRDQEKKGKPKLGIRIGVNTGPVVAGVVGTKKFAYDIWGNTVNLASRMESGSESNRINISEETYLLVKDTFECNFRGKLKAKNIGEVSMYLVERKI